MSYHPTPAPRPDKHRCWKGALALGPKAIRREMQEADTVNAKLAVLLTKAVGSMWAFWLFNGLALISLPSTIRTGNPTTIIAWVSSNWLQLILLPALMVGQNIQSAASDARAEKTFTDIESVMDLLNPETPGGLGEIMSKLGKDRNDTDSRT